MNDIATLYENIVKYAEKPDWAPTLKQILEEHITFAANLLKKDIEEIMHLLDEGGLGLEIFGLMFEEFLTYPLGEDAPAPNLALAYLKRAGWRETPRARRYLKALAESQPSLYEVLEVQEDQGLLLQDRLAAGEPFWVRDKSITHKMRLWDILYARVIRPESDHEPVFTGPIYRFAPYQGSELISLAEDAKSPRLALLAFAFLLDDAAKSVVLHNSDGEPVVLCEAHIPLRVLPSAVAQKLDASNDWERTSPTEEQSWILTRTRESFTGFETTADDSRLVIARAQLEGRHLTVMCNSEERLEATLEKLQTLLGPDMLGTPKIERSYLEDRLDDLFDLDEEDVLEEPIDPILPASEPEPAEKLAPFMKQALDMHYRRVLRQRIPMLGNKTPRMALRTKSGRKKVIEWLKIIENGSLALGYDTSWMWEALGLMDERKPR